jgi:hypothetical protein
MKEYSNPSRKPMMYGEMATNKRKKMQAGGSAMANADAQSRLATGRATAADRRADDAQRREEIMRMPMAEIRKIAEGSGREAMIARSVLREKGDTEAMPQGDQQPAGMMYGGKSRKK